MVRQTTTSAQRLHTGNLFSGLLAIVCFALLAYMLVETTIQIVIPPPARRLELVQDVPLPSVLPTRFLPFVKNVPQKENQLAPGVSVRFDHFDFQTLDPLTGLLFVAHTGPPPDKFALLNHAFKADKDSQVDGHVIVFDTRHNKVVGRVDVPQIAGIVATPDHSIVYAADANDNIVYAIDERTLKATAIPLGDNERPDAIEYDQIDQKVFVSDVGAANPDNIDPKNQNIAVIDIQTNKVTMINLGHLPKLPGESSELVKFGYDIGHNRYDPVSHRLFVVIQQLTDQSSARPPNPPPGTGELVSIDPISQSIVSRMQLPKTCGIPHGMIIDAAQHTAFIACTEVDPDSQLVQHLMRVNVQTMSVIPDPVLSLLLASKPDIVVLDHPLHIILVGCVAGVSVFDESGGHLQKLGGNYILGKNTHTLAIDEKTQLIYMPIADVGGRPTMRIARFNPQGA